MVRGALAGVVAQATICWRGVLFDGVFAAGAV